MEQMELAVKKFGGTSVGSVTRIRHVARLIRDYAQANQGCKIIVVASAMSGETNKLTDLARSCVENAVPREMDVLLASGEQVTVALLAMALIELGLPAKSLLAQQARISTDRQHTKARILDVDSCAVRETLEQGQIPVVAGFQGVDDAGNVTTLGRGGSDITAVALAAALKAGACYIYTDVEGVYSADPRICPQARLVQRLCHEEMLELASLGAKVLHTRSVYFAMRYCVPLVVLSSFKPGPGTWIVREEELMEQAGVSGITYRVEDAKITISKLRGGISALSRVFSLLARENIFVDMITQSGSPAECTDISFTVPDESSSRALELAQECVPVLGAAGASLERDIAKVSVVGVGMRYHSGVAARMFEVLAQEKIEVQMIGTSEIKISVVIARKYCEMAVRALHDAFLPV